MLCKPLIYLFQLSLEKGVFPDDLQIAKITPIYKVGDSQCRFDPAFLGFLNF